MSTQPVAATPANIKMARNQIAQMKQQVKVLMHKDPVAAASLNRTLIKADSNAAQGKMYALRDTMKQYATSVHGMLTSHHSPVPSVAQQHYGQAGGYAAGAQQQGHYGNGSYGGYTHAYGAAVGQPSYMPQGMPGRPTTGTNPAAQQVSTHTALTLQNAAKGMDRAMHLNLGIH